MAGITIKELAEICGVAVSTVSRAMNDRSDVNPETRMRILAAAHEHGYTPNASARSLKIAATRSVAVIIQGEPGQLLFQMLGQLEQQLGDEGYDVIVSHVPEARAHASTVERIVDDGKFAGVVFLGRYGDRADRSAPELSRKLASIDVPMVFCTTVEFSDSPGLHSSVSVDDRAGAYELTRHLLEQGHRRIAFGGTGIAGHHRHPWALRLSGYRAALAEAGLEADPGLVIASIHPQRLYTMTDGYESAKAWLRSGPPPFTAIVGACDATAIGIGRALHEAGISVPEDCSLTGFDGLEAAFFTTPTLTTMRQPLDTVAQLTSRVLLSAMSAAPRATEQIWIRGDLAVGESTGPAPAEGVRIDVRALA